MGAEELRQLFCLKIKLELKRFNREILTLEAQEIYNQAFQIDTMIRIYELLVEISQNLDNDMLQKLLLFPDILAFLFANWLKVDDSYTDELCDCIMKSFKELKKNGMTEWEGIAV